MVQNKLDKQWLIKIEEESDVFYDSLSKVYRVRLYCPVCGEKCSCRCYNKLSRAIESQYDSMVLCSYKCTLQALIDEGDYDEKDTLRILNKYNFISLSDKIKYIITKSFSSFINLSKHNLYCDIYSIVCKLNNNQAYKVLDEDEFDYEFDELTGKAC